MIENAQIARAEIAREDHGIMTVYLLFSKGGGTKQSLPCFNLNEYERLGWFINRTLETLKLDDWSKVKGTHVRLQVDNGFIQGFAPILDGEFFVPQTELEKLAA